MINTPEFIIQSVEASEFIVDGVYNNIQYLGGGIAKQFTSQASPYAIVFKWDFGDGTIINTGDRSIKYEYTNAGTYIVRHQACFLDADCCYTNDIPWCTKSITVAIADICQWIISRGGWAAITAYDIMLLVDAYLGLINFGFIVRMQDINGAIAYYLNLLDSGNSFTGCSFT
jgi:hypothetical protein